MTRAQELYNEYSKTLDEFMSTTDIALSINLNKKLDRIIDTIINEYGNTENFWKVVL